MPPLHATECARHYDGETYALLRCVAHEIESNSKERAEDLIDWLLVLAGALVFFMQAGFAMICAGCVRKKNLRNTMLKNLLDVCGAALAFYAFGYGFAFGGQDNGNGVSFIGTENFFNTGTVDPGFWFFEYAFSATTVTIVAGTLAERCKMSAYLCYSFLLTGFVYPIAARALWSKAGFLSPFAADPFRSVGVIDFGGSAAVHMTGGTTALIAAWMLGARKGRFYDKCGKPLKTPKKFQGYSIAFQMLGTLILWFGWLGVNPGSALLLEVHDVGMIEAMAAVNTSLSAATGAISALFTNLYLEERRSGEFSFNLTMAMNGCLTGLVAVTASCATIEPWAACVIGIVAGWVYMAASALLLQWKIDDAVDAIPVHLFGGIWGMIAVGLFSSPRLLQKVYGRASAHHVHPGWFYSMGDGSLDMHLLANQIVGILFVIGWATVIMVPFFAWLNHVGWLRAAGVEETAGLDMAYMDGKVMKEAEELVAAKQEAEAKKHFHHRHHASSDGIDILGVEVSDDELSF